MGTTQQRPRKEHLDDGLTLVEMVVAIGILMVVMMSSLGVFLTVQQALQTSEGSDRAIQVANSRIERIRQQSWKNVGFYQDTYDATTASTNYATYLPRGNDDVTETSIILGPTDPNSAANKILPYQVTTEQETKFTVYTTITWGRDTTLGLPTATGYSYKRVRVTVTWQSNGNGATHKVVSESWLAPQINEAAPPALFPPDPEP